MTDELKTLRILRQLDAPKLSVVPLQEQGSSRRFYRILTSDATRVLMCSDGNREEFDRFIRIGRFLYQSASKAVPAIHAYDCDEQTVLMEDLGDERLYELRSLPTGEREEIYRKAVDLIVDMQAAHDHCDSPETLYADWQFDREHLRWETDYFRERCLGEWFGLVPERVAGLDAEFEALAAAALALPRTFVHRDYQSQNLLYHRGRVRAVDFQSARLGPYTYDLASLLRDPYVDMSVERHDRLLSCFADAAQRRGLPAAAGGTLRRDYTIASLQRNMQALGAYAFLTLVKGKTQFAQFITPGLSRLCAGLRDAQEYCPQLALPQLTAIVSEVSEYPGRGM